MDAESQAALDEVNRISAEIRRLPTPVTPDAYAKGRLTSLRVQLVKAQELLEQLLLRSKNE